MRPLSRRPQRGSHDRGRRRGLQAPARSERCAVSVGDADHRQRSRRRPRGAVRRARHARGQGRRHQAGARVRQRTPDHAVPPGAGSGHGALPRQEQARYHQARDRPCVRRQGVARRLARPGLTRPQDLPREARARVAGEERDALEGLQPAAVRREGTDRSVHGLRAPAHPDDRRHGASRPRSARGRAVGAVRRRAGDVPRPRPRHVSVRDVEQPDRGRRLHRRGCRSARDQPRPRCRQGVHDAGRVRPVPDGAVRRCGPDGRPAAGARCRVGNEHRPPAADRLAGPRHAQAGGTSEQQHRDRDHEARRALGALRVARAASRTRTRTASATRTCRITSRCCTR